MTKILLILMSLISATAIANTEIISSPVKQLFIPTGFDNNDNVEIIVSGDFPDSCHSRNKYEVKVNEDKINILITALLSTDTSNCEVMSIPYLEDVTIGSLQAGEYAVTVNNKLTGEIHITEATSSSVDDHLYAMVDYIDLGFTGGINGQFFLVGRTLDCLALDKVKVISNGKDTLSVLPIMKRESTECNNRRTHFSIPVTFDMRNFDSNNVLLFVRTMDGKSVHTLVEK